MYAAILSTHEDFHDGVFCGVFSNKRAAKAALMQFDFGIKCEFNDADYLVACRDGEDVHGQIVKIELNQFVKVSV
jgi:hypothetical protein